MNDDSLASFHSSNDYKPPVDALWSALEDRDMDDWVAHLQSFVRNMETAVTSYQEKWRPRLREWLISKNTPVDDVHRLDARLETLNGGYRTDGQWEPLVRWEALRVQISDMSAISDDPDALPDKAAIERIRAEWQSIHDHLLDVISGTLAFAVDQFGEESLGECLACVVRNDALPAEPGPLVERVLESMGWKHLSGTGRTGVIPVAELDDRWVLTFSPCGSGGRLATKTHSEGEPSDAGILRNQHEWAWSTAGVCHYCAHCCLTLAIMPARRSGHPSLVVEPPLRNPTTGELQRATCTFTVYKDPVNIPPEAYTAIGMPFPSS